MERHHAAETIKLYKPSLFNSPPYYGLSLGFSLVEVLVSVLILAIGLLGVATLLLNTIRHNHSAHLRAVAVSQASNMIDRMRANHTGVQAGHYNNLSGIPDLPTCSSCSTAEIATRDAHFWNTLNAQILPAGQGDVQTNGNRHIITLRWDNDRSGATGLDCSGNPAVDLTCLTIEVQL